MLAWLVAACALVAAPMAPAADAGTSPADAVALPAPLTQDAVRELVSRLSDEDVRKLLIQQLDKSAAPATARSADGADAGVLERVGSGVADARTEVIRFGDGARALPGAVRQAGSALVEQSGPTGVLGLAAFFAGMLGVGAIAEVLWRRASRRWRAGLRAKRASGFFGEILRFVLRVIGEVAHVAIFGLGALIVFFAAWNGGPATRIALLGLLAAFAVTRLVWALAAFLLAPGRPADKLLPLDDATGRVLVRGLTWIALLTSVMFVATQVLEATGAAPAALRATVFIVSTLILAVAIWIVWRIRLPIAALIRQAGGGGAVSGWAADLWPLAAILYLLTVYVARLWDAFTGVAGRGEGIASLAILVAVPIVDYALCRTLARSLAPVGDEAPGGWRKVAVDYEPVLRRLIHIGVIVGGAALLAQAWDLSLFAMAERSLGGRIASSLIGIFIVILLAYVAWDAARTAIDRRLAEEGVTAEGAPVSRLRTLLPLLRALLAVTILVMAVMSVLAAMGVDILPLLAGASVVGVAIGFGSQTLVRDVVSGAFFLADDAFRLGEYIEVGDAKGRIEKITLRSLFLRHHRGALNILPYGEIKRLRNTSRDWMIMVLEFKLALETDLKKVKKIIKAVADEVAADPELGPELLAPIKSQGVLTTDESSLTVRVKYMAKPGDAPFMIRRVAYEKILKAFAANGIHFAGKRVEVYVPPEALGDRRLLAGAAALQAVDVPPAQDGKAA